MKKFKINSLIIVLGFLSCKVKQKLQIFQYLTEIVSNPIPFTEGIILTKENSEFELIFSPDGLKFYFSRRIQKENK